MPDYNLFGLETRSFEQLVQSLAAKVVGPRLIVFGDGPDGAREATFEGLLPYGPEAWQGYTIFQAKFKKKSEGSKKDGEWAIAQLNAELKKFLDSRRALRKPDNYVFATNVALSPVEKIGFKDKVAEIMKKAAPKLGLKSYDVWDYDKIRGLLDGNRDVAVSYGPFIMAGDILAYIFNAISFGQPDLKTTFANFLQKELVADLYVNLEQAGHNSSERIPISRVFVDLPTSIERPSGAPTETDTDHATGFVHEVLALASQRFDPESVSTAKTQANLAAHGKFVLLGGPGQGKTTVGQLVCQLFRASILADQPRLSAQVRKALEDLGAQVKDEKLNLPSARRFPFRIVLSDLAAALATDSSLSVLAYIGSKISKKTSRSVSHDVLREWLRVFPWIIVLDGLDEVPPSANRDRVMNAIEDFWVDAAESNADILVVATTRPQGYTREFSPDFFQHRWLTPLSDWRALHYGQRLVSTKFGGDEQKQQKINKRLERACQEETTSRMMRSPLQVTIMATLVDRMGQPPEERWSLFKEYYNVIYLREVERDIPASAILRSYRPDVDAIHRRVALILQRETERAEKAEARLSSSQFSHVVKSRLEEEGHNGEELQHLQQRIMAAATDRLVFLVGLESDQVGFEIRSLQEFMAAEGIMDGGDAIVRERLRWLAPSQNWRNVFLFAAGKCFAERQDLRDSIHAICAELNETTYSSSYRTVLLGSQLALDLLEDGSARRQPRYAQILGRIGLRLITLPPTPNQVRLANIADATLEPLFWEECNSYLARIKPAERLGAMTCIMGLPSESKLRGRMLQSLQSEENLFALWPFVPLSPANIKILQESLSKANPNQLETADPRNGGRIEDLKLKADSWASLAIAISLERFREAPGVIKVRLAIPETPGTAFSLRLHPINTNWLSPLTHMPNPSPGWSVLLAAERFLNGMNVETLAREFRIVANEKMVRKGRHGLPWVLEALAARVKSESEAESLIERIKNEELGNEQDWIAAEKRWLNNGITRADLEYSASCELPFDRKIGSIGFPVEATTGITKLEFESVQKEAYELLEIFRSLRDSITRSRIASWFGFFLSGRTEQAAHRGLTQNDIEIILNQASSGDWGVQLGVLSHAARTPRWVNILDSVGRKALFLYCSPSNTLNPELVDDLRDALVNDPSRIGLFRILDALSAAVDLARIPNELLLNADNAPPEIAFSAFMLRLLKGGYSPIDWETLGAKFVEKCLEQEKPGKLNLIDRILQSSRISDLEGESFIRGFISALPSDYWVYANGALDMLNQILARRSSALVDSSVWAKMGFSAIEAPSPST